MNTGPGAFAKHTDPNGNIARVGIYYGADAMHSTALAECTDTNRYVRCAIGWRGFKAYNRRTSGIEGRICLGHFSTRPGKEDLQQGLPASPGIGQLSTELG